MDSASSEVWLYALALRSRPVAEALHRAVRERGVRVMLFTPYPRDPGSYFVGLALAGAALYQVADVGGTGVMLVDGRYLIAGPLAGTAGGPLEQAPTIMQQSPEVLQNYGAWFERLRSSAYSFVPHRDLLRFFGR